MKYLAIILILAVFLISACTQQGGGEETAASITLLSPRGGETFTQGQKITIQYDSVGVHHYQIWFTNNPDFACDSAGWTIIRSHFLDNKTFDNKTFEYTLPYQNTQTARVRVEGHSAAHVVLGFACSDTFTIKA